MDLLISAYGDDVDDPLSDDEVTIRKKQTSSPSRIRSRSRSPRKISEKKDEPPKKKG